MDEIKTVCGECGTENEQRYEYCKNCGAPLKAKEPIQSENVSGYYNTVSGSNEPRFDGEQNSYSPYAQVEAIEGVSLDELSAFVGRKSFSIIPKFLNMERRNSNVSWCWPVAVLSWIFGPFGASLWFFYRKMYKAAWITVLIGSLLLTLTSVMILKDYPDYSQFFNEVYTALQSAEPGEEEYVLQEIMDRYNEQLNQFVAEYDNQLPALINNAAKILYIVLGGIFAFSLYKHKAVDAIKKYRSANVDPRYYQMGLMFQGGTSSGMLALGIFVMITAHIVILCGATFIMLFL